MRTRVLLLLIISACYCQAGWLAGGWKYRATLTLTNGQGSALTNYLTQVSLTSSNFTFAQALSDGSDLRVTGTDGTTIIPYTITAYNSGAQTATLWIIATIAGSGTYTPYLYWGNPSPPAFDIPPAGPWTKYAGNPVLSSSSLDYFAEDIVYDSVSAQYWMQLQGRLATSPDLLAWTDAGASGGGAGPHLLVNAGTWYRYTGGGANITYATSSTPNGTFSGASNTGVATQAATWKSTRVLEPYVYFSSILNTWVMLYMGDTDNGSGEQVGYATASSPAGPFTDYGSNPVLAFGVSGSADAGTIADPWAVELNGTAWIGYTCAPDTSTWQTCVSSTTDFITFTKAQVPANPMLWRGASGAWDANVAFRGAVTRVGNTYYLSYSGQNAGLFSSHYTTGIATQSAQSTAVGYPPFQLFYLYDDFSEAALDTTFWTQSGSGGSQSISSGVLQLLSGVSTNIQFTSIYKFSNLNNVLETRAQRTALSTNNAGELGYNGVVKDRIFDNTASSGFWILDDGTGTRNSTSHPDTNYHVQSVWRKSTSEVPFKVDAAASWETRSAAVSTALSSAWLESFGAGGQNTQFNVDWLRVRPYSEPEPTVAFGSAQTSQNSLMFSIP